MMRGAAKLQLQNQTLFHKHPSAPGGAFALVLHSPIKSMLITLDWLNGYTIESLYYFACGMLNGKAAAVRLKR